jgi:hypothetical protein
MAVFLRWCHYSTTHDHLVNPVQVSFLVTCTLISRDVLCASTAFRSAAKVKPAWLLLPPLWYQLGCCGCTHSNNLAVVAPLSIAYLFGRISSDSEWLCLCILQALQLGPTELSRYWIYWVPANYVEAIKDSILGKWQYFWGGVIIQLLMIT